MDMSIDKPGKKGHATVVVDLDIIRQFRCGSDIHDSAIIDDNGEIPTGKDVHSVKNAITSDSKHQQILPQTVDAVDTDILMSYNGRIVTLREDELELGIDEYKSLTSLTVRQSIHLEYSEPPDRLEEMTIDAAGLSSDSSVIDIGPGNGSFLRRLVETGYRGRIAALDRSMAAARSVATIGGPVSLQGDACHLPFADKVFDVVFARHMLYHVSDVIAALREFKRVLRLNGKCVTVVNHAEQAPRLGDLLRRRVEISGVSPPELPRVDSAILPHMLRSVFGNTSETRSFGHLVFYQPEPVITFGTALLGFYGVAPDSPLRADIEAQLADDIQSWFANSGVPWRDSKGFIISVSIRQD